MIWQFLILVLLLTFPISHSEAACLGLGPPTPKTTNVCERVVERIVVPQTQLMCDLPWWARIVTPHCNLPGACHVDPTCKSFEVTKKVGEVFLNAGDLYCEFREISPEKLITGIGNQTYTDVIKLTSGGNTSVLYDVGNRHIDVMSCSGKHLNEKLKAWISCVTSKSTTPQTQSFYPIDVNRALMLSETHPTASLYLPPQFNADAITLDDLVIMKDAPFQILRNWNKDLGAALTSDEQSALGLIIHELVHVRQYRNMGNEVFLNSYLSEAIVRKKPDISMEQEADRYQNWATSILATPNLCSASVTPAGPGLSPNDCPVGKQWCEDQGRCMASCPRPRPCPSHAPNCLPD